MPFNFNNYRSIPSSIKLNGPILAYTRQPTDESQTSDRTVVFNATVEALFIGTGDVAEGTYSFKWYLNDTELIESDDLDIDITIKNNRGSTQLTLSNIGFNNNGDEVYVVSSYTPASNEGALNNPDLKSNVVSISAFNELEITSQPQDFSGAEKITANFIVGARILPITSPQNISYQWQMNNKDLFNGDISGDDLEKYGLTQPTTTSVSPSFQVTADDGSESFTIDWTSTSSFEDFTSGKTYTIIPNTNINTKVFVQGAGGGKSGSKNVTGSSGGIASGYATFSEGMSYKLQVGTPGEGARRSYPTVEVTHSFNETTLQTTSLVSSPDITVEVMNEEAYSVIETREYFVTRRNLKDKLSPEAYQRALNNPNHRINREEYRNAEVVGTEGGKNDTRREIIRKVERVPVPADCSTNLGYRYYRVIFSTKMANNKYEVVVTPIVTETSAGDRPGVFTVAGITEQTVDGFNIWFCNSNPNTGESYADFISSFSFTLKGMKEETTQNGEGGIPGGGGNSLPKNKKTNLAGGGGGYTGLFVSSISQTNALIVAGGGGGSSSDLSVGGNGGLILNAGETSANGSDASDVDDVVQGGLQATFTTPGNHTWVAPSNVTSVSVVCVGGGANYVSNGGGGGGLGYKNNIPVVPGNSYVVRVGNTGMNSFFISADTVKGGAASAATGGDFVGDGGGNGGDGGTGTWEGGGGAGGYSGDGGNGGDGNSSSSGSGTNGSGGAGGGGAGWFAGGGGGVGLLGEGDSGTGGIGNNNNTNNGGGGGSNGQKGTAYNQNRNDITQSTTGGGLYGGGGGRSKAGTSGASGAVRIMWGDNRAYPSTNTEDQFATFDMTGNGGTSSAGGDGGGAGSDQGVSGSALVGGDGSNGAGGGGAGYFGGGGGGGSTLIGGGGGGSSFINSTLMSPNDINVTTQDYSSNVEQEGNFNISFIGSGVSPSTTVSVFGANTRQLLLYSEQGGFGSNVRCTISAETTSNSPLYSATRSYNVVDIRPILVVEAIDTTNGWIKSSKNNLELTPEVILNSDTFGSSYKIIQFYSEESDFNLDIDMKAAAGVSAGNARTTYVGGQGGTSKIRINIKKDVEYTMIGLAENSAIFLYEKARLIAVVGQGGDAGKKGEGGAGGGVNVDGVTGRGTKPGKGAIRPTSGSLTSVGTYGSTVDPDTIVLYPGDTIATNQSGGRTVSCTKGLIYIDEGISPCEDISSEKIRFLDEEGTQYVQSSLLFRGFKAGYSVTETSGDGKTETIRTGGTTTTTRRTSGTDVSFSGGVQRTVRRSSTLTATGPNTITRSGGDGGNGATGGDGGTTNSGGGGGSGYVDDSVTVINTTSGGNPDQVSSVTFSISPV